MELIPKPRAFCANPLTHITYHNSRVQCQHKHPVITTGSTLEGRACVLPARFKWQQALPANATPAHPQVIHRCPHATLQSKSADALLALGVPRTFSRFASCSSQSNLELPKPQTWTSTQQLTPVSQLDIIRSTNTPQPH